MSTLITVFMIVATVFAVSTIGYVIYDIIQEARGNRIGK